MRGLKSLLFAAIALFFLLLPNAQATVRHAPLPPGSFFVFSFPGYSSLHDCGVFQNEEQPLSAETCIKSLQEEEKLAKTDPEYAKSEFFRTLIGEFGKKPLLYDKATILFCEGDCRELKPYRRGPPHMMWYPPEIFNQKTYLVYPLRDSVSREKLRLSLLFADGEWRSNLFSGFWHHNYMDVHLDKTAKALTVERNWKKTLGDSANYLALWQDVRAFILLWAIILIAAIPGLLLAKWRFHWRWKQGGRIFLWHVITLTPTTMLVILVVGETLTLITSLLFYLGSMLPEWWVMLRAKELKKEQVLFAQALMRLPFTLFLIMLFAYA